MRWFSVQAYTAIIVTLTFFAVAYSGGMLSGLIKHLARQAQ